MSAEASIGSDAAEPAQSDVSQRAVMSTTEFRNGGLQGSKYVKLNVGGSLHYTTVQTLSKEDSLLRSMCDGGTEVTIDQEGQRVCPYEGTEPPSWGEGGGVMLNICSFFSWFQVGSSLTDVVDILDLS